MLVSIRHGITALRPKQWTKNILLFVAPFAAGLSFEKDMFWVLAGFVSFSLAASFGYIANDLRDIEFDRKNPRKSSRPFAAGVLSSKFGFVLMACILFFLFFIHLSFFNLKFDLIVLLYVIITFTYSYGFKKIPVVEMFLVASGFVLRLIAGAVVIDLKISEWFLIVGGFGALFVVASKRLTELKSHDSKDVRVVVTLYGHEFLQSCISVSVAVSITAYSFWAFSQTVNPFWFQMSAIPFVMALFRFNWLSDHGGAESPEDTILEDKILITLATLNLTALFLGIHS